MKKSSFKSSSVKSVSHASGSGGGGAALFLVLLVLVGGFFFLSKDPASVIPVSVVNSSELASQAQVPATRDQFFLQSSETPGYATFFDQQYLFRVDYPEGWEVQTPVFDLLAAMFFAPQDGSEGAAFANVNVTVDTTSKDKNLTLQDYADQALVQLTQVFPGYELVDQGERALGDLDGHYLVASYLDEAGTVMNIFSVFAFGNERIYALTYSYLPDQKDLTEPLVDHMIESFELL